MNGFGQGSVTPSRMPRHRRSLPRINDRVDRYDGCECDPVILVDLTERCFLEEDSVFKGPANKQQEISASKKANSSTVKSDHTTSKNAKHMAGASVKTAKVKSPENKSEKPHSAAAIRQTVSQRRCRRSDTPDDDKILPLCSAQVWADRLARSHLGAHGVNNKKRHSDQQSREVLTAEVRPLTVCTKRERSAHIARHAPSGWYLAFTAHKTVGFELAMREPLNAAWKSSSPFKMRRKVKRGPLHQRSSHASPFPFTRMLLENGRNFAFAAIKLLSNGMSIACK
ncbi:unnamed protein product [Toxocara canis]|uniref:Uncharacterized protein n=1 Tax=Toxocara canis TaxID=6265 RepID=A0A183VAS2_TOXCA|nr:unnamed protein product [Toxocara canis]